MKIEIKKLPKSEMEINGEIPFSDLEIHKKEALQKLGANLDLQGFRKGHIPEKIVIQKIGEMAFLNELAERAMGVAYPKIIIDNKIDPIAAPQITITKIATDNPLGFKILVPVMPEIKLPDYREISKEIISKKESPEIKKEDIETVINQVLDSKKDKDGKRPELSDELVKTLGDFKDLKDFNEKMEDGVKREKEWRVKEKTRAQILEEIISKTEVELPNIIIESELNKMIAEFEGKIKEMGLKVDEYLKNNNKTTDELRKEWRGDAEKRGKSQLILNKIAIEEKIYPKKERVEKETEHLLFHHKDADPNRVKIYVETLLTNEAVLNFLENPLREESVRTEKEID